MIVGTSPYDVLNVTEFLSACDMMLSMEQYSFAKATISSMRKSVGKSNRYSEKQLQAIINIWESKL